MKISVLIAAFKGAQFIAEQLSSLADQSRLPDEVLIGDDSGDDRTTHEAVQLFLKETAVPFEVKIFHNESQRGVNENFRNLAEQASGDILFFCDQDDFWLPQKIEKLARIMEEDPTCDAVFCFSVLTDGQLEPWQVQDDLELQFARSSGQNRKLLFKRFISHKICGFGHNIVLRKETVRSLPIWRPSLLYDFWILQSCAAAEKLVCLPERLTLHRIHQQNLTMSEEGYVGDRFWKRLHFLLKSENRHKDLERLLNERSCFLEQLKNAPLIQDIPEENMQILYEALEFLKHRLAYRKRNIFLRCFPSGKLVKAYFKYGNGWRSLLRDAAGI